MVDLGLYCLTSLVAWLATLTVCSALLLLIDSACAGFDTAYGHHAGRWFTVHWQTDGGNCERFRLLRPNARLRRQNGWAGHILQNTATWIDRTRKFRANNGIEFAATYFVMLLALLYLEVGWR